MEPTLIPWKSREEWIGVYENTFSEDFNKTTEAVKTLSSWKQFMKQRFRPGMDCTRSLLQVALKDNQLFSNVGELFCTTDLQLMYSAEIMRFLNLVCNPVVEGRKVSLYGIAKSLGIPDWVVNIRHQMAHRDSLPSIDILRMAVQFILNWLKKHYWEVEKSEMKEVKLEDPKTVVTENLNALLNSYILIKEQSILGFRAIRDIQDPIVKNFLLNLDSYSVMQVKIRCKPWDIKADEDCSKYLKNLTNLPLAKAVFLVIKMMKPFFKYDKYYGVDTIDILINQMIEDSVEKNGLRREVWKTLLKSLHSWYKFPLVISYLADKSSQSTGEESYQSGLWSVELCKALQKRFKVQSLTDFFIKEVMTRNTKEVKQINFDSNEVLEFKRMLRKRKLDVFDSNDERRLTCIFVRVEEKYNNLRDVLRLREPIFPDRWEVLLLLNKLASSPTDFTEQCLIALYDVLKWPFSQQDLQNLIQLTKIYTGDGIKINKKSRIYTVENIASLNSNKNSAEEKDMEIDNS